MKTIKLAYLLVVSVISLFIAENESAQSGLPLQLQQAKEAIANSNAIYFQSFVKNDPTIFIDRYAEDCLILVPNGKSLAGHKGAAEFFKLAYEKFHLRDGKFITTAVYGNGDNYVTEEGVWQSFDAEHKLFDDGKFLVLWKKTPAGWKMFRDSFSSNH